MPKYILKRMLISAVLLFFVAFIIYALMRCLPTSYIETIARQKSQQPGSKSYEEWMSQLTVSYGMDKGILAGYFQWSGWSSTINGNRWSKAKQKKLDSDIELDLLSTELNGSYSKVKTEMQKATDPEEAALYWSEHYEGVALSDGQTKASDLKKNARKWYNLFKDTLTGDTTNAKTQDGGGVTSDGVPAGYSLTKTINTSNYTSATYPWGQCTWFVYNRAEEVGVHFDPYMGNGGDWKQKAGYQTTHTPTEHSALSFSPGQAGADPTYGHIAFVEQVKSDGSILISEANAKGLGVVSYRTFDKATANQFTYVIGK